MSTRRFRLQRDQDITGVSGTGIVADGIQFPDGAVVVRWRGEHQTTVAHDKGISSVIHIHGHDGATRVVWLDDEPWLCEACKSNDHPALSAERFGLAEHGVGTQVCDCEVCDGA